MQTIQLVDQVWKDSENGGTCWLKLVPSMAISQMQDPHRNLTRACRSGQRNLPRHKNNHLSRPYLGGAVGTTPFVQQFIRKKVKEWTDEIQILSEFATTQPHAAYAAFAHGLSSSWNYLLRVTDWEGVSTSELSQPLETAI